jgi:hypothetical protein
MLMPLALFSLAPLLALLFAFPIDELLKTCVT